MPIMAQLRQAATILFYCLSLCAAAVADDKNITVTGVGNVVVVPDHYRLVVTFEERGPLVTKLNQKIKHDLSLTIKFLQQQGIPAEYLQSMQVNLSPWVEHSREGSQHKGFIVTRQLRIMDEKIERYDSIIDGVLQRGANRIDGFELGSSQQEEAYRQALVKALQQASQIAEQLAKTMDMKIKSVVSIAPVTHHSGPMPRMLMADQSTALPGQESLSAAVSVTFALE